MTTRRGFLAGIGAAIGWLATGAPGLKGLFKQTEMKASLGRGSWRNLDNFGIRAEDVRDRMDILLAVETLEKLPGLKGYWPLRTDTENKLPGTDCMIKYERADNANQT